MNYGTLTIMDGGVPGPPPANWVPFNKLVRMGPGPDGALAPPPPAQKTAATTFTVDLNYAERAYLYGGPKNPQITSVVVRRSQSFKRVASGGNPIADATNFISRFSGCPEARKVRGRAIALSRMHGTISGERFRFPLEAP